MKFVRIRKNKIIPQTFLPNFPPSLSNICSKRLIRFLQNFLLNFPKIVNLGALAIRRFLCGFLKSILLVFMKKLARSVQNFLIQVISTSPRCCPEISPKKLFPRKRFFIRVPTRKNYYILLRRKVLFKYFLTIFTINKITPNISSIFE